MKTKLPSNLVALIYNRKNNCYPEVTDEAIEGLEIDLEEKKWSCPNSPVYEMRQPRKIGQSNYFMKDLRSGVIGVYDRNNLKHLTSMIKDWEEITDAKAGRFGD